MIYAPDGLGTDQIADKPLLLPLCLVNKGRGDHRIQRCQGPLMGALLVKVGPSRAHTVLNYSNPTVGGARPACCL